MDFAKFSPDHFLNLPCNAKQCQTNVNFILSISILTITGQQALSLYQQWQELLLSTKDAQCTLLGPIMRIISTSLAKCLLLIQFTVEITQSHKSGLISKCLDGHCAGGNGFPGKAELRSWRRNKHKWYLSFSNLKLLGLIFSTWKQKIVLPQKICR